MGNELKNAVCPAKHCSQGSLFVETLPVLIALAIVAFFSGTLFDGAGMDLPVIIVIEAVFVVLLYSCVFVMFRGMKKRQAETYMSVCENGICGVCPQNGYKNREFSLYYHEIDRVAVKGERLFVYAPKGNVILLLEEAPAVCALIQSKLTKK